MNRKNALLMIILFVISTSLSYSMIRVNAAGIIIVNQNDSIQNAINNATAGDTIFVKKGIYNKEHFPIIVNKTVTLCGEDLEQTIIDGKGATAILLIRTNGVRFQNFTVQNGSISLGYGIGVFNMKNIVIFSCKIQNCYYGIQVGNSTYCNITQSKVTKNAFGIYLNVNSSHNLLAMNWIYENSNGLIIDYGCKNNSIYHNTFLGNAQHTTGYGIGQNFWNNTYPFGGNFWSGYIGTDFYSGSNQTETGSDGIGDEPYQIIQGQVQDSYPLMDVWTQPTTKVFKVLWGVNSYEVCTRSNLTITHFIFNGSGYIVFNVTGDGFGFCNVTIPRDLLDVDPSLYPYEWVITIDGIPISSFSENTNETHNSLFFTLEASTYKIEIEGNVVIPEFLNVLVYFVLLGATAIVLFVKKPKEWCVLKKKH
jgi:parallel beta-helix repeat protein